MNGFQAEMRRFGKISQQDFDDESRGTPDVFRHKFYSDHAKIRSSDEYFLPVVLALDNVFSDNLPGITFFERPVQEKEQHACVSH